jgi:hypothetical protein
MDSTQPAFPANEFGERNHSFASALRIAWVKGCQAARRNRLPGFVMWLFGIAIVGGYFFVPAVHELLNSIGRFKIEMGWKFSLVSTAMFGGLIPALVARTIRANEQEPITLGFMGANTILWAYKGVEIDLFYHFQAWLFGNSNTVTTIAIKTICDQFVMVPLFGIVNVVLFYRWRDRGYSISLRGIPSALGRNWYSRLILPVLIANWVVWIPAVAMIYTLPTALQLPVQNLILCFWVLILLFFTNSSAK